MNMRKYYFLLIALTLYHTTLKAQDIAVSSPDKKIDISVHTSDVLSWSARYSGKTIIENVEIGITKEKGKSIGPEPKLIKHSLENKKETISPAIAHKDAHITSNYNELTLLFKSYSLTFRVYNDGVAYQFKDLSKKASIVSSETFKMTFPENTSSFFPEEESMYSHNERYYKNTSLQDLKKEAFCSLPVLFQTPDHINILYTETALHDYPGMFLQNDGNNELEAIFPKYVLETVPNTKSSPDRNDIITKEGNYIAQTPAKMEFPWRVFIITNQDKELVESNLTYQLAQENTIKDTEWIKPGKVAWDWYNANNLFGVDFKSGINTATYKYYIDFASKNNIEYVILDEGWTKSTTEILEDNDQIDVKELIEYGKSKNVGIILWVLWKPLNANMDEILETYASWGAKGIKVDFMQRNDETMVQSYEAIARKSAEMHLLVDFHGAFKPSGLRRKYPNVVNYEGVKGNENNKWSDNITPEHNVTLPFIRMVAGPMDFTPGSMRNAMPDNFMVSFDRPMTLGTRCHQVAMYVVYEAPLQMMCESPSIYYKEQETVDFISQIPTTWDETRVLEGKVGDYIMIARRKGDKWYIGAMTDWTARTLNLDLSFLPDGPFKMTLIKDGINAEKVAVDYKKETVDVTNKEQIEVNLSSGGGWAAIIEAK